MRAPAWATPRPLRLRVVGLRSNHSDPTLPQGSRTPTRGARQGQMRTRPTAEPPNCKVPPTTRTTGYLDFVSACKSIAAAQLQTPAPVLMSEPSTSDALIIIPTAADPCETLKVRIPPKSTVPGISKAGPAVTIKAVPAEQLQVTSPPMRYKMPGVELSDCSMSDGLSGPPNVSGPRTCSWASLNTKLLPPNSVRLRHYCRCWSPHQPEFRCPDCRKQSLHRRCLPDRCHRHSVGRSLWKGIPVKVGGPPIPTLRTFVTPAR